MQPLRLTLLLSTLLLLSACGFKGPVQPRKAKHPNTPAAVEVRQQGKAMLLGWQLPRKNLDGSAIEEPPVIDIFRMSYDPADDCPECFDRSTLLVSIDPELPAPARQLGKGYLLLDRQVEAGNGYQYKFIARGADDEPGKPLVVRQEFVTPIAAPQQTELIPHDRSTTLKWQAVALAEGDSLIGYQIYRATEEDERPPNPANAQPLQETSFEDFNLENGRSYRYWIRALVKRDKLTVEGIASESRSAVPQPGL